MVTRRTFLGSAAAASALAAAPSWAQSSQSDSLPEPIAKLPSMRHLVRPLPAETRPRRIEKARALMVEHKLDAILLAGGTSLNYFSNVRWGNSERLFAMVLPAKGEAFFVCPAFEEERAREQLATGPFGADAEVLAWEEDHDPYTLVKQGLAARKVTAGTLGIEETCPFVFSDGVAKAAPALRLSSATPVTAGCRQVKDADEVALMRLASQVTLAAYEAAYRAVQPGMSHTQFGELIAAAHTKLGFRGSAGVIGVGPGAALPHGSVRAQTITENSLVLIDGGCAVEGYRSDITRTFVVGKPTDKMKHVFEVEHRAQAAALKAARPGVPCEAVDAAARKVIVDAGFGPDYRYFTHRVGHGIGMDGHEWPYLVRGNKLLLAPGMTFSDEPGIYLRGEFGVRLEDEMVITAEGAELLTPQSPSLQDPFGG
jgi:Xaa-Pro dipeptidase